MARAKTKKSREEKLIEAKLRMRKKYQKIKNDPEKYALQKEKERIRYLKRKEEKKLKSVADMTPRQKRYQRKKWTENSKRYIEKKKKNRRIEQLMIEGTPPTSDQEENAGVVLHGDPIAGPSHQVQDTPSTNCIPCKQKQLRIRKLRYNYNKQIGILKSQKEKAEKERDAMKRMLSKVVRASQMNALNVPSTEKKVDRLVDTVDSGKREEIKKKLLFGEIVSRNLSEGFRGLKKKEKRVFSDIIMKNNEKFKEYKVLGKTSKFSVRKNKKTTHEEIKHSIPQQIEDFFEDDSNTKISPEKNEFVTRNGVRKQKRYLTDTLQNLHKKFMVVQNGDVAYSTFCKYRPFWVLTPKESDRNTCACKVHVNFDLLVKSLNKNRIIKEANGTAVLQSLCCDVYNESCLNRDCDMCKNRVVNFQEFNNDEKIIYYEWCASKEKYITKGIEKVKIVNTKTKKQDFPKNVIEQMQNSLNSYFKHCANIVVQYRHVKALKATISSMEAVVHLDFSENYSVQFNEEIQSFHFGGSRTQITLHTSVVYIIDQETGILKPHSVCSISECNQHDAKAIWAHLIPLLSYIQDISPLIDTVHFISDSPSSQYRNRYMFHVIGQLHQDFPELKYINWNYLEAGHGKGAPDGVGAVLKRTADKIVRMGKDIGTIEEFKEQIQNNVKNIKLLSVSEKDVEEKMFPLSVPPFRGTMLVHQVLWSYDRIQMTFRNLSCLFCKNGEICAHGYHLGFIDIIPASNNASVQLEDFMNQRTTGSFFKDVETESVCPSPIIENLTAPEQTQQSQHNRRVAHDITRGTTQSKAVTLLSNVKQHWTNESFIKKDSKATRKRTVNIDSKKENKSDENLIDKSKAITGKGSKITKATYSNYFKDSSDEYDKERIVEANQENVSKSKYVRNFFDNYSSSDDDLYIF